MSIMQEIKEKYGVTGDTDSYKFSHIPLYPKDAVNMVSYMESRGGDYDKVLWVGATLLVKEHLCKRLTHKQIDNFIKFQAAHMFGNITPRMELAFRRVVDVYGGFLPIKIIQAKEGLAIPVGNVLLKITCTVNDPDVYALVSFYEAILMRVWDTVTVATKSWHMRKEILDALYETADDPENEIWYKLHDFGSRGAGAAEEAAFAGMGHLVSFKGSDTTIAILATNIAYKEIMSANSIPASEHSVTCAHGLHNEHKLVEQMFENYAKPGAIFATVIDSKDTFNFIENIAPKFKQRLIDSKSIWVFRPDSGDPVEMPIECIRRLDKVFGHTLNSKGFKVLNNVRVIQGDGITHAEVTKIISKLIALGWSITNIAFGMGGGLLRSHTRDTQKFSIKCSAILKNNTWVDVYKDPAVYDEQWNKLDVKSFKTSKKGDITLVYRHYYEEGQKVEEYKTIRVDELEEYKKDCWHDVMETLFENGHIVTEYTLEEIRKNAGVLK